MMGQIRLQSSGALAEISVQGAEIRSWEVAGQPLLWKPDAKIWAETAPVLFPVVGWTRNGEVRVADKVYPLGLHGFARHKPFSVAQLTRDFVRLVLESDAQTLALYPFDFRFTVDCRLDGPALSVRLGVENRGSEDMPYACGLHPGFRWPLGAGTEVGAGRKSGHCILFDAVEEPRVHKITSHGLFAADHRPVPLNGKVLDLTPELFAQEALCFLGAKSQGLRYETPDGAALRVEMTNFPHIALWSKPEAPFLAIELWTGHGDPDGFEGDLFAKPSMRFLPPGRSERHEARFTFYS